MASHDKSALNWSLREEIAPTTEPVTLIEAKLHLRVDTASDDTLITALIVAARLQIEKETKRTLVTTSWKLTQDVFPGHIGGHNFHDNRHIDHSRHGVSSLGIDLDVPPIQSVTTVKYFDTDGSQQTLVAGTDYQVDTEGEPGRLLPAIDKDWPDTQSGRLNAVEVIYVAGYGAASTVPQLLKQAILWLVTAMYEQRSDTTDCTVVLLPKGVDRIIGNYRLWVAV